MMIQPLSQLNVDDILQNDEVAVMTESFHSFLSSSLAKSDGQNKG